MSLSDLSDISLIIALFLYIGASIGFVVSIIGKSWRNRDPEQHNRKWRLRSITLTIIGLVAHLAYYVMRWIAHGFIPNTNMFEFMTMLSMMIVIAFVILYFLYRSAVLGIFTLPVALVILAYASVFPAESQALNPALNSQWLKIHVTLAALGEAFFAVAFAAGFMYLLRTVDFTSITKRGLLAQRGVEAIVLSIVIVLGFVCMIFTFRAVDYRAEFIHVEPEVTAAGIETGEMVTTTIVYKLPPIVQPYESDLVHMDAYLGISKPLFTTPGWMKGADAGRKFNTVIWSLLAGTILYGLLRLIFRKRIGALLQPLLKDVDPEDLDEIGYRAIALGFPIFTLGALIFAMIWAHIAWGRFWDWDPKETWALITWLFYSAYLHLRLSKGWQGSKSAWLAVLGFVFVMFTLVGVNLILASIHAYAGV